MTVSFRSIRDTAWIILVIHLVVEVTFIGLAIAYLNLGLGTRLPTLSYELVLFLLYAFIPLAAISFAIDRKVVEEQTGWSPSAGYYLLSLPFVFNIAISVHYLYQRHQRLGTP